MYSRENSGVLPETFPGVEAFSGNAISYGRGMSTVNKYKTVKEVCALTGLTGKHLYYFHHEKVVQAAAFANYSVEGYDGYKLYDDEAAEKLQQIALYYQLGLRRNEIKDIMLAPNYDGGRAIETMLELVHKNKVRTERHAEALEYLKSSGINSGFSGVLNGASLEELGETIIALKETENPQAEKFSEELAGLLEMLGGLTETQLLSDGGTALIGKAFVLGRHFWGISGYPLIFGMFSGASQGNDTAGIVRGKITAKQGGAIMRNITARMEFYKSCACVLQHGRTNN